MRHLGSQLGDIVSSLNGLKDDIEQLQEDNLKLNDDLQVLEKDRDNAYKSFNTETHILIEIKELEELKSDIEEANSCAANAEDEANSAKSCADDSSSSASYAVDYCRDAENKITKIINNATEEKGANDGEE